MRYARVQQVLEQEDAFVAKMGSRTEAVFKPDGEKQLFSPEVIAVTQAIHSAGKDAHKVHKTEIVRIACQVFRIGRSDPPPAPPATNGAVVDHPAPTPPPAPKPTPQATPKPNKAIKKQPPKPKAKQAAPPKPPEPPKAEEPSAKIQTTPPAEKESDKESRSAVIAQAKELLNQERPGENQVAFNAYISIYSMMLMTLQLLEMYDTQPGKDKRYKTLDEMAKEVNKFTSIKSAKEAQKAQP